VTTTLPDEPSLARVRRAQTARRVGATVLVLFVLAGALGLFGTRTSTASSEAGGYRVEVTYPQVSRPGHAVRFEVLIHRDGGFPDPIRVRMSGGYFDLFDENAFGPDPESQTTDATYEYFEYQAPEGEDFLISSDTRVEPARQRGESGEVSVLDAEGHPVATVRFRTRIWP
jgi:hypothetical protein